MRKSTLIISAILTAALLFALYSLLAAYRKAVQTAVPSTSTATLAADNSQAVATGDSTAGKITIYDAAVMAVKVLGRSDLYIVENTQLNGADVYLATFVSGDIIYISLDGQVLSTSKVEGLAIKQPKSHKRK